MKEIPLTRGYVAIVDDEDYEALSKFKWCATKDAKRIYANRKGEPVGKTQITVLMHRVVIGAQKGESVDHINGNTLDNRRENLRICDHAKNARNRRRRPNRSRFKGLRPRDNGKWEARIWVENKGMQIGTFATEEQAALAYDDAARKAFGEYAALNFPREGEQSALNRDYFNAA